MIKFGVFVCVFLIVFRKFLCSVIFEGHMIRNITFDNTLPTQTFYYMKTFEGVGLIQCGLQCFVLNPECVAVLYSKRLSSCKLLKFYLTELSINKTSAEVGWEYWYENDFCPVGWLPFDGHCYFLSFTTMNWTDAQAQCELHEAYLVEVVTMAENTWILETLISPWNNKKCPRWAECCKTWIGATDVDKEGNFTWNRRRAVGFTNWKDYQPDNHLTKDKNGNMIGQHCALFCRDGVWDDNRCLMEKTFICEKE